ncbi:Uncharacterised protein [Enterobacter ludwigii]|nr:hypothetical protein EcloH_2114 [Enterobacter ludwigii]CAH0153048.1 hypothetical protein SRABI45_00593 [Enterobacter ludwigii]VAG32778.1 Uncharacterised protein [Enterobacter ludwigii]VAG71809.1 Uncharacterised protein [Enterobacter ludwigii]
MLFSGLGFLFYSRFGRFFVVLLSGLRFLLYSRFSGILFNGFFVVFFSSLGFLLCSRFSGFMVFLVVYGFCRSSSRCCSWRSSSRCSSGFSSKRSRRQTHSSGNNQS